MFDVEAKAQRRAERVTARQRYEDLRDIVFRTMSAWVAIRSLPAVVAMPIDPDRSVRRNHKWTPSLAHFVCDVERITAEALKDAPDLQLPWFALAAGETVDPHIEKAVVNKVGRLYSARGIDPPVYFRKAPRGGAA